MCPVLELPSAIAGTISSPFWGGVRVTCTRACELAPSTWSVGMHGWPGGLPAHGCPPSPFSFLTWPPTHQLPRTRRCRTGPGEVQGVGLTHSGVGGGIGSRSLEGGLGARTPGFSERKEAKGSQWG